MSEIPSHTAHMAMRSRNATSHPGLVDARPKRIRGEKTKKEIAEEKKKQKAQQKEDAVHKIANIEQRIADDDSLDVTPGPRAAKGQASRKLQRTKSYMNIPLTEEIPDIGDNGVEDNDEEDDTGDTAPIDGDTSEVEPPKKKVKPTKASIRDAVNTYIEKEHGEKPDGGANKDQRDKGWLSGKSLWDFADDEEMVSKQEDRRHIYANQRDRTLMSRLQWSSRKRKRN